MKMANSSVPHGARCGAKARSGHPCRNPAGFKTEHPGVGRCRNHGGCTPIKHGRYSIYVRSTLGEVARLQAMRSATGAILSRILERRPELLDDPFRFEELMARIIAQAMDA